VVFSDRHSINIHQPNDPFLSSTQPPPASRSQTLFFLIISNQPCIDDDWAHEKKGLKVRWKKAGGKESKWFGEMKLIIEVISLNFHFFLTNKRAGDKREKIPLL
jgi:hypothetical protein